jgi:hypothetical protein
MGTGTHQDKPSADRDRLLACGQQVTSVETFAEQKCNMGIYVSYTDPLKQSGLSKLGLFNYLFKSAGKSKPVDLLLTQLVKFIIFVSGSSDK